METHMEQLKNTWTPTTEVMEYLFEEAKGFHKMENVFQLYYTLAYATLNVTDEEFSDLPFKSKSSYSNMIAEEIFEFIENWLQED